MDIPNIDELKESGSRDLINKLDIAIHNIIEKEEEL